MKIIRTAGRSQGKKKTAPCLFAVQIYPYMREDSLKENLVFYRKHTPTSSTENSKSETFREIHR